MMTAVLASQYADGAAGAPVPADLDRNRVIDGADLSIMMAAWGEHPILHHRADLNSDRVVDGIDFGILLAHWGPHG